MGTPSITERKYVRRIPGLAEEPTSTLVLTSRKSYFVDVRIFKPTEDNEPDLPNEGGPMTRLEWAFAGRSRTEAAKAGSGEQKRAHTVWEHWVDSHSDDPAIDEGDMWPQPNGDVLEQGTTVEPGTGVLTAYEELWRDLKVEVVGQEEAFVSIVLSVQDDRMGARGMVVRVGGWCQGILKVGNKVTIERWQWKSSTSELKRDTGQDGTDRNQAATTQQLSTALEDPFLIEDLRRGEWERVVRLGSHFVPCAVTFNPALIERHGVVEVGDAKWEIIENYHWSVR